MKTEYSKNNIEMADSFFEGLRKQGSSDVSRTAFHVICAAVLVFAVTIAAIVFHLGIDFIKYNLSENGWMFGLVLLSVFNGWIFKKVIEVSVMLWKMTKEDEDSGL